MLPQTSALLPCKGSTTARGWWPWLHGSPLVVLFQAFCRQWHGGCPECACAC